MIQQLEQQDWQQALRQAIGDWSELCTILGLDPKSLPLSPEAMQQFPLRVPREFVSRMERGNPRDPLLLQIFPDAAEMVVTQGYSADALNEAAYNPVPGLLHKYASRVLLTLSGSCPINCRYCFRRHFPYEQNVVGKSGWDAMVNYIAKDPNISEVILSGGEPLLVKDDSLALLFEKIAAIPHVKICRIHTRMPIVIPQRIDDSFLNIIQNTSLKFVMVLHCNHPNEIDASVVHMIQTLKSAKITVLNQSVLLRHVNDSEDILVALSEKLFDAGCLPYYIHLLDKVAGASHFEVSEERAKELNVILQERLSGYLVPKFVREVPDMKHKVAI